MKVLKITARNVEKAIEQGLKELNKTQEEVDIKIIDEGGFFKKAKIELYYESEDGEDVTQDIHHAEEVTKEENTKELKDSSKNENISTDKSLEQLERDFLNGLFDKMSVTASLDVIDNADSLIFNATGDNVSKLIGKRGETLNAIQDLMSQVARKNKFKGKKVFFDVENYKNRREMALIKLAEKMSKKAITLNKPIKLERLNAYERRIVHTAIAEIDGVTTHSEGEEPHRHLIIIPDNLNS